ncbi:hypothetical protein [Acetobacter tropicalis]|nr:hypothetical protein [Acetobacter tropicalis]
MSNSEEILERMRIILSEASRKVSENTEWASRVIENWNKGKQLGNTP